MHGQKNFKLKRMYQSLRCHSTEIYTKTKEIQRRTDKIILMTH
jgi:hypothetical protein